MFGCAQRQGPFPRVVNGRTRSTTTQSVLRWDRTPELQLVFTVARSSNASEGLTRHCRAPRIETFTCDLPAWGRVQWCFPRRWRQYGGAPIVSRRIAGEFSTNTKGFFVGPGAYCKR